MGFAEKVKSFIQKSLGGEDPEEKKDETNAGTGEGENQNSENDQSGGNGEKMEKSDLTDATDILNALVDELKTINKSLIALSSRQDGIEKAQADVGEAVVGVAELVSQIANSPMPPKTTMAKGGLGNTQAPTEGNPERLTMGEFNEAQLALTKSYQAKEISMFDATRLESEMQKAMQIPGYQMSPKDRAIIAKALKTV